MSDNISHVTITDPILKRNYFIIYEYLIYLLDSGLNYLKRTFMDSIDKKDYFKKFSMESFYDFILRDNIRNKVKSQMRAILNGSVACASSWNGKEVPFEVLEEVLDKKYPLYERNDMSLLHTSETHPGHQELRMLSKLTYRVCMLQLTRLIVVRDPNVKNYEDLTRIAHPTKEDCLTSIRALLGMVDETIDCFETNLDMINIPIYRPTFTVRDFVYVRKIYEYALKVIDEIVEKIYINQEGNL
jgi:hypothetical protein